MNEFLLKIGVVIVVIILGFSFLRGCSEQSITKNFGGETELILEPNRKLVEITWKDNSLWYLTREMGENEEAEEYLFQEKDPLGTLEGTVIVKEVKMSEEEYNTYLESFNLQDDYYKTGNSVYDEQLQEYKEVYIHYDMENNKYIKIREYQVDENTGELIPAY